MARFFRRYFDVFPQIDLVSVVLGGSCGYVIGEWSGKSRIRELIINERMVDRLFKKANEAERELMLNEEKKNEILRSLRDLQSMVEQFSERERALQNLEKQLKERERKVEMAEKKSIIKASFDSDKYAYNSVYTGTGKSSSQDINMEGASNKLEAENAKTIQTLRRPGQSLQKVNRGMILAPLGGIILNLFDASMDTKQNDIVGIFASMDCPDTVLCGFQYLCNTIGGYVHLEKLRQLEKISSLLVCRNDSHESKRIGCEGEDRTCCICYACEADTRFVPCSHVSCFGCITRHLLNCQRCFFCNATVVEVIQNDMNTG